MATKAITATKSELANLVPTEAIKELSWYTKLTPAEQASIQKEGQALSQALIQFGYSRLAVGEHLSNLRNILEPHNSFGKFLKTFHFSKRTAYRYIAGFNNAKARLPEPIMKAAMARGVNIIGDTEAKPLGIYTQAVAKLPPPQNPDATQAKTWLDQIENVRKDDRSAAQDSEVYTIAPQDPNVLLKECYKFVSLRYKRLPNNHKVRSKFVNTLVGMLMTELGVSSPQSFSPTAVPEEFRAQRGRPRVPAVAAAA